MNKRLMPIIVLVLLAVAGFFAYRTFFNAEPKQVRMPYTAGDSFVTNIKETKNYLKTGIVLYINTDDSNFLAFLEENKATVRDVIIFVQRGFTMDVIDNPDNIPEIRQQYIQALNERFEFSGDKCIIDLVFTDFVLQ